MEICEVNSTEYDELIKEPYHVFGNARFSELNKNKVDQVFYLLFRENSFRLGMIVGCKENILYSPFSAPFGGFLYFSGGVRLQHIEEAVKQLIAWASEKKYSSINIILPPSFYDHSFISKQISCLWRGGFAFSAIELNYSFILSDFDEKYSEKIWRNARKNLRIAMNAGLEISLCQGMEEKETAYNIIATNRASRGFPLRMALQEVIATVNLIHADFFLIHSLNDEPVASAIVFHVGTGIVQVVYWGDLPGYTEMKPMNFLSFKLFEYYKSLGKQIIDIGHSTDNSVPNYGLCEFKESIGCTIFPRYRFSRILG